MARRAAGYVLVWQGGRHECSYNDFVKAVEIEQYAVRTRNRRVARLKPKYRLWIEHSTGLTRFELTERPEPDPAGVRSWWPLFVGRVELYFGGANATLYEWQAQVEGIH